VPPEVRIPSLDRIHDPNLPAERIEIESFAFVVPVLKQLPKVFKKLFKKPPKKTPKKPPKKPDQPTRPRDPEEKSLGKELFDKFKEKSEGIVPIPLPIMIPSQRQTEERGLGTFTRVYLADDADVVIAGVIERFADEINRLVLPQPIHARRRRKVVASRN